MVLNVYGGTSVLALPHPAGPHVVEAAPARNEITRTATIRDGLRHAIARGDLKSLQLAEQQRARWKTWLSWHQVASDQSWARAMQNTDCFIRLGSCGSVAQTRLAKIMCVALKTCISMQLCI